MYGLKTNYLNYSGKESESPYICMDKTQSICYIPKTNRAL